MNTIFEKYDAIEGLRLTALHSTVSESVTSLLKSAAEQFEALHAVNEVVQRFNSASDLREWSQRYGPGMQLDFESYRDVPPPLRDSIPPYSVRRREATVLGGPPVAVNSSSTTCQSEASGRRRSRSSCEIRSPRGGGNVVISTSEDPQTEGRPTPADASLPRLALCPRRR